MARYRDARQCAALQGGGESPRGSPGSGPSRVLDGTVLLLDVLPHDRQRRAADGPGEVGPGPQALRAPVVPDEVGELLAQAAGGDALEAVDQLRDGDLGREVDQQVHVVGVAVEHDQLDLEVVADHAHDLFHPREVPVTEHAMPILGHEHRVCVQQERAVPAGERAVLVGPQPYGARVQLRYAYRLNPTPGQRQALARAFGCARVVFNDADRRPGAAREAGAAVPDRRGAVQGADGGEAHAGAGVAGRGVRRGAAAGVGRREHRVPELLHLPARARGRAGGSGRRGSGLSGIGRSRSGSRRPPGSGSPQPAAAAPGDRGRPGPLVPRRCPSRRRR